MKNAVKMCGLCVLLFVLFLVLTKVDIELEQRSLFSAALVTHICSFLLYICFGIAVVVVFVKSAVTNRFLVAIIYLGLFITCCPCLSVGYLIITRGILNASRPVNAEHFIKERLATKQLSALSREMIQKRNVFWVGNGPGGFTFGLTCADGNYLFDSRNIPKNYRFDTPIPVEDTNKVRHLDLPFQPGFKGTDSKILGEEDYKFCARASSLIRRIGFDNVKLYPEPNIVQYQIYDFMGWDNGSYYIYYYSPDGQIPDEFKYNQKLNDNWYYDARPRFR
ncbi:MAG: hypothetical protein ABSB25_02195 [Sedimentisphaerales bacterium]